MTMMRKCMSLATAALLISVATAMTYTVGGPAGGWDISTNLKAWATTQSFLTGDKLAFQYMPSHDVVEVTKADYDTCQAINPLQSYNDGNTVISLTTPGKRYFICSTMGHCVQGMKLEVDTLATSAALPAASPTAPQPENETKAPEVSPPLSPFRSPLGRPTLFPLVPSVGSPVDSPSSVGSALQSELSSATKVDIKVQYMVGLVFSMLMLL